METKLDYSYLSLTRAAGLLGMAVVDLIHAAGNGHLQLCVNVYGRARELSMKRIEEEINDTKENLAELEAEERGRIGDAEFDKQLKEFLAWKARCTVPMPDGVYEIGEDIARFLEMPEGTQVELTEAYKFDARGWWEVEFGVPLVITRDDLILLREEFLHLQNPVARTGNKQLDERERASLLCIIGALACNAKIDLSQPHKAASVIAAMLPGDVKLSARTIGEHLKNVRGAIDSRKM